MHKRAFVLGSNGPTSMDRLKYAVDDAKRVARCLRQPKCRFEVDLITEGVEKFSVLQNLERAVEKCNPDDTFVCYFAGHGVLEKGQLYLVWETEDESLIRVSIQLESILGMLRLCKASNILLILDCCHAGAAARMRGTTETSVTEFIKPDNFLILMASEKLEKVPEIEGMGGSFLAAEIENALGEKFNAADADGDRRLSIDDLVNWLERRAAAVNKIGDHKIPYPYLFGQKKGDLFIADLSEWKPYEFQTADGSTMVVLPTKPERGRALCIGKHPITNAQYKKYLELGTHKEPCGEHFYLDEKNRGWRGPFSPMEADGFKEDEKPVVCVSYQDSVSYAIWAGHNSFPSSTVWDTVRIFLPTPALWDFAAFGTKFPPRDPTLWLSQSPEIHHDAQFPASIEHNGSRTNRRGVSDLIGNIWEWCRSEVDTGLDLGQIAASSTVLQKAVLRGGSFLDNLSKIEPFISVGYLKDGLETKHTDLGFRIAGTIHISALPTNIVLHLESFPDLDFFKLRSFDFTGGDISLIGHIGRK